jgi:allantoinase
MPLNSVPPTVDVEALETKRACARGSVAVDVGFWGGAVPGNRGELRGLHEAGVFGFKCFLLDSGVAEFPPLPPEELEPVLAEIAELGSLLIVRAEDAEAIDRAPAAAGYRYADFLASRPRGAAPRTGPSRGCWSGRAGRGRARTCCTCRARTRCPCSRRRAGTGSR